MPAIITVEDVTRFRACDSRAAWLVRHKQVVRDNEDAAVAEHEVVYTVADERVILRQVPGGYTATHDCPECVAGRSCFRALAAVDAEGTDRWIQRCQAVYHATKLEMAL